VRMSARLTKKSFVQRLGPVGEDRRLWIARSSHSGAHAADENRQLGAVSVSNCARSTSNSSAGTGCRRGDSCGTVSNRFKRRKECASVWSCEASVRPGVKGTFTS